MPSWLEKLLGSDKYKSLESTAKFSIIEEITIKPQEIGRGSYGTVYAAVYDGKPCVAKETHSYLSHSKLELFVREINTLSALKHPSIVQFLGIHFKEKSSTPILVMERMWKNLCSVIEEWPNELSLLVKTHILYDVACGLQYLHSQKKPVVHRDLHPSNVLLNENFDAKIADLGQAKPLDHASAKKLSTAPGNIPYMAPETLKQKPVYDTKLDTFSLGCTIIHLVTEKFPLPTDKFVESDSFEGSFRKVTEADRRIEYLSLMTHNSVLQRIAYQCLEDAPSDRPDAPAICKELEKYIPELEAESPVLAKWHKQDKNSLLHLLQSQEGQLDSKGKLIQELIKEKSRFDDVISKKDEFQAVLESELKENRSKMEQFEFTLLSYKREKDSLQKKLANQDEVSKQLTTTYRNQVDRLRDEVKANQEEARSADLKKTELQKEFDILQNELQEKKSNASEAMQKIKELENRIQRMEETFKTEKDELIQTNVECKEKILVLEQEANEQGNLIHKMEESFTVEKTGLTQTNLEFKEKTQVLEHQVTELQHDLSKKGEFIESAITQHESAIADLNEKLKASEHHSDELSQANNRLKSRYIDLQKEYKVLEEAFEKQQVEGFQPIQEGKVTDPGSTLHQKLMELQAVNEKERQQLQQDRQSYINTFKQQDAKVAAVEAQLSDTRKKSATYKQQLEEKSYRLSMLESALNELQESSHSKDEKVKSLEDSIAKLSKLLENNDNLQRVYDKELERTKVLLTSREEELQLRKKEHADELNNLCQQHKRDINGLNEEVNMCKSQIASQEEISRLLRKEAQVKCDYEKSTEDRFKKLDNDLKKSSRVEKELKRQLKYKDSDIKEKAKRIGLFEKNQFGVSYGRYNYDINWYPYMYLPIVSIRPSAAIIKGKVFISAGYQLANPQGKELEGYLQFTDDVKEVVCFHVGKCQSETLSSPVVFGALASVNGQCVLVSGADSVGNTLTGNVYALCEDGSHEQWKEFSKPLPTPRILACACCYGGRWLIVCGGYASKSKGGSKLLEAVDVIEILDATKGEWYQLPEGCCPNISTVLHCAVVGDDVYVVGSDHVIKTSCNKLIKAATSSSTLVWDKVEIERAEESIGKLYPFSVIEVNGEPMIIASMSDSEDDVTCVVMKDTRGRWRMLSKAVECQHCSAAVVTSTLELLLFGGSKRILVEEATDMSQNGTLIPTLNVWDESLNEVSTKGAPSIKPATPGDASIQGSSDPSVPVPQPGNLSFTGPIHTVQFDHNGGTFQSPIHKVSLVVPPNALSDGEKLTVYMGATTSGPFDLPEDCKLRSAVVWLSVSPSDVVLKRSVAVMVPHSAVFTSPQHRSMMRFVVCEDHLSHRYKFSYSLSQFEIDGEQGWIDLDRFAVVAIVSSPEFSLDQEDEGVAEGFDSDEDDFHDAPEDVEHISTSNGDLSSATNGRYHRQRSSPVQKKLKVPPARYLAKLFWPHGQLPSSFRADVYYFQNLPTELYKVDTVYRNAYKEDNGMYPEVMETEFLISGSGADLSCVLPCKGSSTCDCLTDWDVTQMTDMIEVQVEKDKKSYSQYKIDPMRFSFKFICLKPEVLCNLTCCFELQGVDRICTSRRNQLPLCLQKRFHPFILEKGLYRSETAAEQQALLNSQEPDVKAGVSSRKVCQPTDII